MASRKKIITSTVVAVVAVVAILLLLIFWYFFGYTYNILPLSGASVQAGGNATKLL